MKVRPDRWHGVTPEAWALIVAMPLAQVGSMALTVVVAPMREGLALTYSELGIVLGSFGVARVLMDLPAGALIQRFNPRRVLLISLALGFVAAAIGCVANAAWHVAIARIIHGGSSAVVQTVILAWLMGRASPEGRGRVMALGEALFSVVGLTTPAAVGLLAAELGWRAAFALGLAGTAAALLLVVVWTRPESAALATGKLPDASPLASADRGWRGLRVGGAAFAVAIMVTLLVFFSRNALMATLLPLIGVEKIGMSTFEVGLASSLLSAVSIGAILAGGWVADHIGRTRLVVPGVLAMLVGHVGLFLISDRASFFTLSAVLGVGFVLSFLPVALISDALPATLRSRGISLYRLVADGAILVAPLAVGLAVDLGGYEAAKFEVVLVTAIILVAVTAIALVGPSSSAARSRAAETR